MVFSKKLKSLALASSLFFLVSCATPVISKYRYSDFYRQIKQPKKTYAILVSGAFPDVTPGDNYLQDSALEVYDELRKLGLSDEDIHFLATRRNSKKMEKSDDLFTYKKFNKVCDDLSSKVTEDDVLLFIYIGHGIPGTSQLGWDYAIGKNIDDTIEPEELSNSFHIFMLESELNRVKSSYKIIILDACYSGQGAKYLSKKDVISISSTCEDQKSWVFSKFVPYLMKALNGEKEADKNRDKKVSLEEAVDYAAKEDFWSKKKWGVESFFPEPQIYYEEIDPSKVFLKE